jgi:hypothetical protein
MIIENEQVQGTEEDQAQANEATPEQAPEQVQGSNEASGLEARIAKMEETYKKELAGLNRTVSQKDKQLKQLEREKMTEAEQAKDILEEAKNRELEIAKKERNILVKEKVIEAGLPSHFMNRIQGEDEEAIIADIAEMKKTLDSLVNDNTQKEVNKRFSSPDPKGGQAADSKALTRSEFDGMGPMKQAEMMKNGYIITE